MAAGQGTGKANSSLALMAALGDCGNLNNITHVHMNELTTVAAVWALAPFMSGNTQAWQKVSTSSTNASGLRMAFAAAGQVVNISTGTLPGTLPAGATLQTAEVNTIADVLEFCINSIDPAPNSPSTSCSNLFAAAPSASGNPADTITAAMNIAQNPARNVTTLNQGVSNTSTFNPVVANPTAFTIAIQYTGGELNAPTAVAADQQGQIWVTNSGSEAVSRFDNLGNAQAALTLAGTPTAIAIDLSGNAWVTASNNDVYELTSHTDGSTSSVALFTGFNAPTGVAVDPAGYIWVVNSGNSTVSAFNSSGTPMSGSPFNGGGSIASPAGIAINGNANANCADCH
jgi:streptogramin lyase